MPINVSEALDSDTGVILTVKRTSAGSYVDGIYVPGAESNFKSVISPQQPTPKQLLVLPEGQRDKDIMMFISKKPLRTLSDRDGTPADIVVFKGREYEIIQLADWETFGHTIGYGVRTQ